MNPLERCHKCVPPKRKPGCHAHCPEYKEGRAILDEINYIRSLDGDSKAYVKEKTYELKRRKHLQ